MRNRIGIKVYDEYYGVINNGIDHYVLPIIEYYIKRRLVNNIRYGIKITKYGKK